MEFRFKCCLRLFGRWESVKIQGTERTYKFYAYHMLDRLLTIGLILTIWIILYSFFMRSPRPNSIPVRFHMVGLIYWPKDVKIIIKITMPGRHPAQIGMKKVAAKLAFFLYPCYTQIDFEASRHRLRVHPPICKSVCRCAYCIY